MGHEVGAGNPRNEHQCYVPRIWCLRGAVQNNKKNRERATRAGRLSAKVFQLDEVTLRCVGLEGDRQGSPG